MGDLTEAQEFFLLRSDYTLNSLGFFYRSFIFFEEAKKNKISYGYYNYWFINTFYERIIDKTLKEAEYDEYLLVECEELLFDPVKFLANMLSLQVPLLVLNDYSELASIYDWNSPCTSIVFRNLFLGLSFFFNGLCSDYECSEFIGNGLKMNLKYTYECDGKLFNYVTNLGYVIPYFKMKKKNESDVFEEVRMFLSVDDNKMRFKKLFDFRLLEGKGKVVEKCAHGRSFKNNFPEIVETVDELVLEQDYDLRLDNPKDIIKEEDFKNGTKNALSILHFIDFYRDRWSEVDNIYVVGVAGNPHLLAFADFFFDKQFYFFDGSGFGKAYNTLRLNVHIVDEVMDVDFCFLPNSVIVSDIRTELDDLSVTSDFLLQLFWSTHANVLFGTYKFRFPYFTDMKYDPFKYDFLFIQCYKNRHSQESRLYISKTSKKVFAYDYKRYDRLNYYFNINIRFQGSSCNDCRLREKILRNYKVLPFAWAIMFGLPTIVRFKKYKVVHEEFCCRLKNPYLSTCGACIVENGWATGVRKKI